MGRRVEGSVIKCNDPRGINTGSHWLDSYIFDLDSWTQIQRKQSVVLESRHASEHLSAAGRLKLYLLTASKRSFSILQRSCTWTQGRCRINSYLRNLCWMWFQFGHVLLQDSYRWFAYGTYMDIYRISSLAELSKPCKLGPSFTMWWTDSTAACLRQLTPDETAQVISATHAVIPPPPEAENLALLSAFPSEKKSMSNIVQPKSLRLVICGLDVDSQFNLFYYMIFTYVY